jgi:hypothetical protein
MQTDGSFSSGAGAFNPRLPAVIPRTPPGMALPHARVVPGHWLILVTVIASSGVGILGAKVWPYPGKPGDTVTVTLAGPQDASHAGDDTDHPSLSSRLNRPAAAIAGETCRTVASTPQLVMSIAPLVLHANEPAPLGLRIDGALEGAQLIICGFAAKSTISAGHSGDEQTWTLPASDAADATLIPPPGFVGVMQLDLVLLRADRTVADRKTRQLQWQPQVPDLAAMSSPLAKKPSAEAETERHLEEGKSLAAAGNLSQARVIFLRLAQAGNPHAAFLYADSYDPISLAKRQLLPPESDLALSRTWYRKAYDLGSQEANARLERLSTW